TEFLPLFEKYAEVWVDVKGEPSAREMKALAQARAIAEAADTALGAPGLGEMVAVLEGLDPSKRESLRTARAAARQGAAAESRFAWQAALSPYLRCEAQLAELGWLRELAVARSRLGNCYYSLGQYQKAIASCEQSLALSEQIGNPQDIADSLNTLGLCCMWLG